jgi:hypothetical protein
LIGGVIAALVGGGIWSVVVNVTGYEIGFVAWGIGLIAGFAVVIFSGGRKGVYRFRLWPCLSSVLGILAGKYFIFFHIAKGVIAGEEGAAAAANIPLLFREDDTVIPGEHNGNVERLRHHLGSSRGYVGLANTQSSRDQGSQRRLSADGWWVWWLIGEGY